jgi:hypothetical protein
MSDTDIFFARLEMLIGHLSDVLQPSSELIKSLRLRSQAVTTRRDLEYLIQLSGGIFGELGKIRDEMGRLREACAERA